MEKIYELTEKDITNLFYSKYPELIDSSIKCDSLVIKVCYEETDNNSIKDKMELLKQINFNINRYQKLYKASQKELSEIKLPAALDCIDYNELFTRIKRKADLENEISDIRKRLLAENNRYDDLIKEIEKMDLK